MQLKDTLSRSTVCIKELSSNQIIGTGIFISLSPTIIMTCSHVLGNQQKINKENLYVIYNQRQQDPRKVINIWFPEGKWTYRKDVALLTLEAPFECGEHVIPWSNCFPAIGEKITFCGNRVDNRLFDITVSNVSSFEGNLRGCYMLQDGCTKGFSGGLVTTEINKNILAVGMVVANYKESPMRTWAIPAISIEETLKPFSENAQLSLVFFSTGLLTSDLDAYIDYLCGLRQKNKINISYIDVKCKKIEEEKNDINHSALNILKNTIEYSGATEQKKMCILGNYGTGKTCLAIEASYQLAKKLKLKNKGVLPLYIPLKIWNDVPTQENLINYIISDGHYPFQTRKEFTEYLKQQSIFFVFDGIDELTKKLSAQSSPGVIQRIPATVPDNASFAILGRTSFFINKATIMTLLDISNDQVPKLLAAMLKNEKYEALQLKPINNDQIDTHIEICCKNDIDYVKNFIKLNYDLPGLATRPVLLNIIIDSIDYLKNSYNDYNKEVAISSADLYETYIQIWLKNPKQKSHLTVDNRLNLLEKLAMELLENDSFGSSYENLANFIHKEQGEKEAEDFLYDLANCTFLDLINDNYEFSHKSFLEYFVARGLARKLLEGSNIHQSNVLQPYLSSNLSLNEIINFLRNIILHRCCQDQKYLSQLYDWLKSDDNYCRLYVGHILGHVCQKLKDQSALKKIINAYHFEEDPLAKRSLALACGKAGEKDILQNYSQEFLPHHPHRKANLYFHLKYYGSLERTVLALISHICENQYDFLREIDIFTLQQIKDKEEPLGNEENILIQQLNNILKDCHTPKGITEKIQNFGIFKFVQLLSH